MLIDYKRIQEEYAKCFMDTSRIYMIENYCQTYDGSEGIYVPFHLFPKQKEWAVNISEHPNNIILKSRQSGFSTVTAAIIACNFVLAPETSPETGLIITNKLKMAEEDFKKVTDFIDGLPRWFFGEDFYHPDPDNEKNKRDIYVRKNLHYFELACNGSKLYARSSGPDSSRGVSGVSFLFFDETAFIERGAQVSASAIATTATVKKKNIVMVSTPNGKDELFYETYNNSVIGKNNYKVTYLKWYHDPRFNRNLKWWREIEGDVEKEEFSEETIDLKGNIRWNPDRWKKLEGEGWKATSPWYIDQCNDMNQDRAKIAQELETSFLGSDNIAVDPKIIEMQRNKNVSDDYKTDPLQPNTWIWKPPIPGHRYIMAVDGSRGDAGDNSAIQIFDIDAVDEHGQIYIDQVLEYCGKMAGDLVGELAYKYGMLYNQAFCIIELIGGYGEACMLTMLRCEYPNLYYDNNKSKEYLLNPNHTAFIPNKDGKLPGFHQKGAREQMISNLISKMRDNVLRVRSSRVIGELETWIIHNGKITHKKGKNDDTLLALALGLFVYDTEFLKLKHLKEMDYAIMKGWVASLTSPASRNNNPQNSININPNKYNDSKVYTSKKMNSNTNELMWVFGKNLNKGRNYSVLR